MMRYVKVVVFIGFIYALYGGEIVYSKPGIMTFDHREQKLRENIIPTEIVGTYTIDGYPTKYEFRDDGKYFVLDRQPYQLIESGMTLVYGGVRYSRLYGDTNSLIGVWLLESDPTEEWNLRSDGSYTYHFSGFEYFGEYTFDTKKMNTKELRAIMSESAGTLTFDPPYALSVSGTWSIVDSKLAISFPSGDVVYNKIK